MLFESGVGHANLSHVFSCHLMVSQTNAHHVSKKRSVRTSSFESGLIPSSDKDMVWPDPESFCLGVIGQLVIEALAPSQVVRSWAPSDVQAGNAAQPASGIIGIDWIVGTTRVVGRYLNQFFGCWTPQLSLTANV